MALKLLASSSWYLPLRIRSSISVSLCSRQSPPRVPEYSSAPPRPLALVPPASRLALVLKPSWLDDGLVSVWKPPLTVGSSGIARVTKLTTPPTFCGP
jgi:hypothetical protein